MTHLHIRVIVAYVLLSISYLAVVLTLCVSCQPMHHFWQIHPNPGRLCQPTNSPDCGLLLEHSRVDCKLTRLTDVMVCVIPNIVTDVYLLSIPLPVSSSDWF